VAAAAVAATVAGINGAFGRSGRPGTGNADPTSTAAVTQQTLTSQTQMNATLGNGGSYSVVNQASGTITALPSMGSTLRQGQVLYQVDGSPVVLLYGQVPAYRALSDGMTGADVAELNADLVSLGYATSTQLNPRSGNFSLETAYALEKLQAHLGLTPTGDLTLGQAVFLPGAIQVTSLGQNAVPGSRAQPGSALLTASSTTPVVTINLDPAQESEVKDGEQVTITLPSNQMTPGVVSSIGTVATTQSSGASSGSGSSTGSDSSSGSGGSTGSDSSSGSASSSATITVEVALSDPKAAAGLTQAPVTVTITTGSVKNALVVPVDALLAQPGGEYAVEVTGPSGHHLAPVSVGLFDDAAGLVQVTGSGLAIGQHVVVPAT
jgi:hypothetical protein